MIRSYAENYCYHTQNLAENHARARRLTIFQSIPEMEEVLQPCSVGHRGWKPWKDIAERIENECPGRLDHVSYWCYGRAPLLLNEPYDQTIDQYEHPKLSVIKVPTNVAPYCGKWRDKQGELPASRSFLIAAQKDNSHLNELAASLVALNRRVLDWNYEAWGAPWIR